MKSLIGLLLCVVMLVGVMSVAMIPAYAESPIIVMGQEVYGKLGATVEMPITISSGHYVVNGVVHVYYDPTALRLLPYEEDGETAPAKVNTATLGNSMWEVVAHGDGKVGFAFATGDATGNETDGAMFTLKFKTLKGAAGGTDIEVKVMEMMSNSGGDDYATNVQVHGGKVLAPMFFKGDVSGDGSIAVNDAMQVFYHTNRKTVLTDTAFEAADLDGDGVIELPEVMRLFYYVNKKISGLD